MLAEETLATLGYEPVGFDSSIAALQAFRADPQRFALVLTDETMPDLIGTELAREIRRVRRRPRSRSTPRRAPRAAPP
jgi:CheY-like chemotaxis protein